MRTLPQPGWKADSPPVRRDRRRRQNCASIWPPDLRGSAVLELPESVGSTTGRKIEKRVDPEPRSRRAHRRNRVADRGGLVEGSLGDRYGPEIATERRDRCC